MPAVTFYFAHKLKVREAALFVHNEAISIMYYEIYDDNLFIFMYSNDVIETKQERAKKIAEGYKKW